ncbi:ATP synthase, H+ transporting, mitochondrial F1 c omplex, delta subunit [Trichuris trichiura]|uniref:F-ATPase delta subunit n=1 Tax=Trichuris trichiura TaxID=36087 RepID=A0A077Z8I2_TRITR|nr:ATP synthase, H+ transporting, mitochondrial F1 c omplex, delta subunit [Trichuris trichiura]
MLPNMLKCGIQRIGWLSSSVRQFATGEVADKICLTFASSSKVFYKQEDVQQVNVPTIDGEVGIYPTHVPLIGVLKPGVVTVTGVDNDVKKFFVSSGSLAINEDSSVQLLAEEACTVEELDLQQCELGLEKAKSETAAGDEKAQAENAIALEVYEALVKACHEAA